MKGDQEQNVPLNGNFERRGGVQLQVEAPTLSGSTSPRPAASLRFRLPANQSAHISTNFFQMGTGVSGCQ
ncbi:hypothetical protein GN956_G6816 [Arapaima gigas]